MTPSVRDIFFSSNLSATPSFPSWTLAGIFEQILCRSRALALRVAFGAVEKLGHCQVCCARLRGSRTPSK